MKKTSPPQNLTGWFEVLYRNEGTAVPNGMPDILPVDYKMIGDPFPIHEFGHIFDAVEFFLQPRDMAARLIREYDIINFFRTTPTQGSSTLLVIEPVRLPQFGYDGGSYFTAKFTNLILIPTQAVYRFAPFRYEQRRKK